MTEREEQANAVLQEIAKDIKAKLPENFGFALLAYEFGEGDDKKCYISQIHRGKML